MLTYRQTVEFGTIFSQGFEQTSHRVEFNIMKIQYQFLELRAVGDGQEKFVRKLVLREEIQIQHQRLDSRNKRQNVGKYFVCFALRNCAKFVFKISFYHQFLQVWEVL